MKEISKKVGNVSVDVHNEGVHNIDGKKFPYGPGIKIKVGKSKPTEFSATELLYLLACLRDPAISAELQNRYEEEQELIAGMKFE